MRRLPSYQQWAALTGLHLTLDIWWNKIQLPWCMRYKSSPISSIRFIQAMQNKNSLEFVQFPTVTEFKPKTTRKPLSRDIAAAPWRRIKKRQTTNAKSRKEEKKKRKMSGCVFSRAEAAFRRWWMFRTLLASKYSLGSMQSGTISPLQRAGRLLKADIWGCQIFLRYSQVNIVCNRN